jgi:hypothetical protein
VAAPDLTETTIRYLYATTWLPCNLEEKTVAVPGGTTTALDTASSLLHIALWNLRRQGTLELAQLRPVEDEPVRVFGGQSFSSYELRDSTVRMSGLEGALIEAAGKVPSREGRLQRGLAKASDEDDRGLRRLLRQLELDDRGPWRTVCNHCFSEAHRAGLVAIKGRLFKKVVFTDHAAVEALRERHDRLHAARKEYMEAEADLSTAVAADCLRVIIDGYSPGGGDNL